MSKKKLSAALRNLSESAFDFLERSVEEIKAHPKYSVIHFATAVELILKARLMREHWTLVVERTSDVSVDDFLSGKAKTVTQGDAIKRLKNACSENIPQDAVTQFAQIAAHRNRMIHFFHEAAKRQADDKLTEEIVKELCLCWFHLERLLSDWDDQFDEFEKEISTVTWRMKQIRAYLQVAFDRLKPDIDAEKKAGTVFKICSGCGFEAAAVAEVSEVFFEQRCKVCGLGESYIEIPCPGECGETLHIDGHNVSGMTCEECGYEVTREDLSEALDTEFSDPSDFEPQINCAQCSSLGSVVQHGETFVCTECLYSEDSAPQCDWCNERQIGGGEAPPPPKPTTQIEMVPDRAHLELRWPNVLRVETVVKPELAIDWSKVQPLVLDPASTPISAELAPALGGATDMGKVTEIDLEKLPDGFRLQRLVFQAARKAFAELSHGFTGTHEYLAAQLVRIVEAFLNSDRLDIPSLFHSDALRRRILIALNIDLVVQHVLSNVTEQNTERLTPVFDEENPMGATGLMRTWYTTKPCFPTSKSHISHLVGDSAWEGHAANVFEKREDVLAYAKNDHLGFQIYYMWAGSRRRYVPDFLVRLAGGTILALEIKGTDSPQNKAKRDALNEWVKAINAAGGFGRWTWDVAFKPGEVQDIITKHAAVAEPAE